MNKTKFLAGLLAIPLFAIGFVQCKKAKKIENQSILENKVAPKLWSSADGVQLRSILSELNSTQKDPGNISVATGILNKNIYTEDDFVDFFQRFYTEERFYGELNGYLYYQMFHYLSAPMRIVHQKAILRYFHIEQLMLAQHKNDTDLNSKVNFLNAVELDKILSEIEKTQYMNTLKNMISRYPYMKKVRVTDAQQGFYARYVQNAIMQNSGNIDAPKRQEFIQLFDLTGHYKEIMQDYGVFMTDNNGATSKQFEVTKKFFSLFPEFLMYPRVKLMSMIDYYPRSTLNKNDVEYLQGKTFNTFNTEVGAASENAFPNDVTAYPTDLFSTALSHELGHQFESALTYYEGNAYFQKRQAELIRQAGSVDLQYLRSFSFQDIPQEFVASHCNQWFSSTMLTFELAKIRFAMGYKEPMNQFMFMLDLMARFKENKSYFYLNDTQGNLQRFDVDLYRNEKGQIIAFYVLDFKLENSLQLDANGNVISYNSIDNPTFLNLLFNQYAEFAKNTSIKENIPTNPNDWWGYYSYTVTELQFVHKFANISKYEVKVFGQTQVFVPNMLNKQIKTSYMLNNISVSDSVEIKAYDKNNKLLFTTVL
jgi:hypothetical protein